MNMTDGKQENINTPTHIPQGLGGACGSNMDIIRILNPQKKSTFRRI
jgi:hypothetical protein